ncbi:hypothetical protein [Actinomadura sp. WMMB 499]|uniref:hypothetical protein n=1 Tax=Actinomadura sp. WMMB 499 TaxID=1219491 RepID=UPI001245E93C|nr:hypothetical protein [Actinomadura sp. WMMB 499]QFG26282.1 hypothetical protein F7P10_39220 [Actinomadura sp. WMMB 499]
MVSRRLVFSKWSSVQNRPDFLPSTVATELAEAIAADPESTVLKTDEVTTGITVIEAGSETEPTIIQLLALRGPTQRPSQYTPGEKLGPLPLLDDQYPADVTHVAIWPDGIVGQDLHSNAPRLGRLSFYLRKKLNQHVAFEQLFRPDMRERLEEIKGHLRTVQISLTRPEYIDTRGGAFATLIPQVFGEAAPSIAVTIGMGRYGPRNRYLNDATEEAVFQVVEDMHDLVDRLIISGRNERTGRIEEINLLNERMQVHTDLPPSPDVDTLPDERAVIDELKSAYRNFQVSGMFVRAVQAQAMRPRLRLSDPSGRVYPCSHG